MASKAGVVLLLLLCSGHAWGQVTPLNADEKTALIAKVGELMVNDYVYPELGAAAKARIDEALKSGAYATIVEPDAFATRLTEDLRSVTHDKHLHVYTEGTSRLPPDARGGFARVDRLQGRVGFIKLTSFPRLQVFAPMADQAMADLADTEALIIDLSDNGGGNPESVSYFCSFFFDPQVRRHVNDLIDRKPGTAEFTTTEYWTRPVRSAYLKKPVYLLTCQRTFSGGEEFAYDLKVMNRARVVGATTGGGANPGSTQPLNAGFGIFLPGGRARNPVTQTSWEGVGVVPHVAVDDSAAFKVALLEILAERGDAPSRALRNRLTGRVQEDAVVKARLLKFRTTPQAGSEAALRQMLASISRGEPDYEIMTPGLASLVKSQLPVLREQLGALGAVQSVTFRRVDDADLDIFDVALAQGSILCGLLLTADGKVDVAWWQPVNPGQSTASH
jgi:hypothetical protein